MFKTLICPACKRELQANDTQKVLTCSCGNKYKNPYYKDMELALVPKDNQRAPILARLFALRASYFRVNGQRTVLKKKNEDIKDIYDTMVSKPQQRVKSLKSSMLSDQDVKDRHVRDVIIDLDGEKDELNKVGKIDPWSVGTVLTFIFIALGIAVIIAATVLMWKGKLPYPIWNENMERMASHEADVPEFFLVTLGWGALFGVCTFLGLEIIMIGIMLIRSFTKSVNRNLEGASIERRKKRYANSRACKKALIPLLEENNERNLEISHKIEDENRKIANTLKVIDIYKNECNELSQYIDACMQLLEEQFNDLVYVSDWDNLDYIIYLFVTQRADTMKEALQLLDEQKRSETLAKVVEDSTRYLSKNIKSALRGLQANLDSEFKKVNERFDDLDSQTSALRSRVVEEAKNTRKFIRSETDYLAGVVFDCR